MKKILLLFLLFFWFYVNSFALLQDFDNPTQNWNKIWYKNNETQDNINYTINIFCAENWYASWNSYLINTSDIDLITYYDINFSSWLTYQLSPLTTWYTIIKITCDDWATEPIGWLSINWIIWTWALDIITINNWKIYLEKDNFFYFFVVWLVIILLFRTVIFIFISSVKTWMNFSKWKTYFKK